MLNLDGISKEEALSFLPSKFVAEFNHALSLESMLFLISEYGGTNIYIPEPSYAKDGVLDGLPAKDIHAICEIASGCIIEIPKGEKFRAYIRDQEIIKLAISGIGYNEIARQYDITTRTVRRIIHKSRIEQSRDM